MRIQRAVRFLNPIAVMSVPWKSYKTEICLKRQASHPTFFSQTLQQIELTLASDCTPKDSVNEIILKNKSAAGQQSPTTRTKMLHKHLENSKSKRCCHFTDVRPFNS